MSVKSCPSCGYVIIDPSQPCTSCEEAPDAELLPVAVSGFQPQPQPQPRGGKYFSKKTTAAVSSAAAVVIAGVLTWVALYGGDNQTIEQPQPIISVTTPNQVPAPEPEPDPEPDSPLPAAMSDADFIVLCQKGSLQEISDAVKNGANLNASNRRGWTPLMFAVNSNPNPDVITTLIKAGADISARDNRGITPFMLAVDKGNLKAITAFIKAGVDVNAKDSGGITPFMYAAWAGSSNPEMITALIEAGANVSLRDEDGWTPLMYAASKSNPEVITALTQAGADANAEDEHKWTPLMLAVNGNSNPEVITALVKAGANVNAKAGDWGRTLLMYAAEHSSPEAITALVEGGADVNAEDDRGWTPLTFAMRNWERSSEAEAALTKAGARKGPFDYKGFIRLKLTRNNVNLRNYPSMDGDVLTQIASDDENLYFIAASQPQLDNSDGSAWYELFFAAHEWDGSFRRLDRSERFDYSTPYVNAGLVKTFPPSDGNIRQIDYFNAGRPPRYNTGDLMENLEHDVILAVKKPFTIYLEPDKHAESLIVPADTKIIVEDHDDIGCGNNNGDGYGYNQGDGTSYYYMDMDDDIWTPVIAEDKRIIGWIEGLSVRSEAGLLDD